MKIRMLGAVTPAAVPQPARAGVRIAAGIGVFVLLVVSVVAIHNFNRGDNARLVRG